MSDESKIDEFKQLVQSWKTELENKVKDLDSNKPPSEPKEYFLEKLQITASIVDGAAEVVYCDKEHSFYPGNGQRAGENLLSSWNAQLKDKLASFSIRRVDIITSPISIVEVEIV